MGVYTQQVQDLSIDTATIIFSYIFKMRLPVYFSSTCATMGLLFLCSSSHAATFTVNVNLETVDQIDVEIEIKDQAGTALPSSSFDSTKDKYKDLNSNPPVEKLMKYWKILFNYDATKKTIQLDAEHLWEPETPKPDIGKKFSWNTVLPPLVSKPDGSSRGSDVKQLPLDHIHDNLNHQDIYDAGLSYSTNSFERPDFNNKYDSIFVSLTGKHCQSYLPQESIFNRIVKFIQSPFILPAIASNKNCLDCCTPVSEPNTLFGAAIAIGFCITFKNRFLKVLKKK